MSDMGEGRFREEGETAKKKTEGEKWVKKDNWLFLSPLPRTTTEMLNQSKNENSLQQFSRWIDVETAIWQRKLLSK